MARIVMKFGGTSMAGTERIRNVATRVREIAGGARNPGTKPRRDLMMSALARPRLRRA